MAKAKAKTKSRTTEDVLRDQENQVETDRKNTALARAKANALAADDSNPWIEVSAELDRFLGAPLLKYSKQGEYTLSDEKIVPLGTRVIAHADEIEFGWVRWEDGKPTEKRMGKVADKFVPAQRKDLGDNDQQQWEVQEDGTRRDPWQFNASVPVGRLDAGGETYLFSSGSKGGIRCINGLSRAFGKRVQDEKVPGLPIVELQGDRYKHRVYSWIYYPVWHIVGWTGADGKPLSLAAEMNDAINI